MGVSLEREVVGRKGKKRVSFGEKEFEYYCEQEFIAAARTTGHKSRGASPCNFWKGKEGGGNQGNISMKGVDRQTA